MDVGDILQGVTGSGGDPKRLVGAVGKMVQEAGGVGAVVSQLRSGGLDDVASSWVGTGPNAKPDARKLSGSLGRQRVRAVAKDAGVSEEEAERGIASALPALIDRATPDGRVPDDGGASTLSGLMSALT